MPQPRGAVALMGLKEIIYHIFYVSGFCKYTMLLKFFVFTCKVNRAGCRFFAKISINFRHCSLFNPVLLFHPADVSWVNAEPLWAAIWSDLLLLISYWGSSSVAW